MNRKVFYNTFLVRKFCYKKYIMKSIDFKYNIIRIQWKIWRKNKLKIYKS